MEGSAHETSIGMGEGGNGHNRRVCSGVRGEKPWLFRRFPTAGPRTTERKSALFCVILCAFLPSFASILLSFVRLFYDFECLLSRGRHAALARAHSVWQLPGARPRAFSHPYSISC